MFKHFIWDFDGTLFDSYPHMSHAFQRALSDLGVNETPEEILRCMKLSVGTCIAFFQKRHGLGEELRELYMMYEADEKEEPVKPYEHVGEVLHEIIGAGGKNYIYTHRKKNAIDYVRAYNLDGMFADAITGEDDFRSKPAPDAICYLIARHNIDRDSAIMVGDRDIDILAGANAGIAGCLFDPDGYYEDFQVMYRVKSMREFETLLLK